MIEVKDNSIKINEDQTFELEDLEEYTGFKPCGPTWLGGREDTTEESNYSEEEMIASLRDLLSSGVELKVDQNGTIYNPLDARTQKSDIWLKIACGCISG